MGFAYGSVRLFLHCLLPPDMSDSHLDLERTVLQPKYERIDDTIQHDIQCKLSRNLRRQNSVNRKYYFDGIVFPLREAPKFREYTNSDLDSPKDCNLHRFPKYLKVSHWQRKEPRVVTGVAIVRSTTHMFFDISASDGLKGINIEGQAIEICIV